MIDALRKGVDAHKYDHGHAVVLTGGAGRTGAARLAARGALRIGAGLVTLAVPPAAQFEVASQITALMLARCADGAALAELLEDRRISALCLGPGMGVARAAAALDVILTAGAVSARPTVLDADALTALAGDAALMGQLHELCILTPHEGEFARLFPDIAQTCLRDASDDAAQARTEAVRRAAAQAGCTVLLKGPTTLIAAPDGDCAQHRATSAAWLATAGSGDVLAGFITGLLARGLRGMQASEAATWLHGACGGALGAGLIAEDLPEALPQVFRAMGV
jgi:hydroxyethylthiazole kinase-like uncharacterized protein yjeF